jgi:hypothetical protein
LYHVSSNVKNIGRSISKVIIIFCVLW